jgi:hypothetical protein
MVKNDALFSYVAPSNIFAWLLTPLRYCLPFRLFIKLNRTVIKITHFPLLLGIYAYEKIFLAREVFEPTDLIENMGRTRDRFTSFNENRMGLFSPSVRLRQDSVAGFQKDTVLDDVFRLAPRGDTLRSIRKTPGRSETHHNVSNWMEHQGGAASPPQEQDRSIVDRLEMRRRARWESRKGIGREISGTRSVASDPAEFMFTGAFQDYIHHEESQLADAENDVGGQSDADGDDELVTNDDDEGQTLDRRTGTNRSEASDSDKGNKSDRGYFQTRGEEGPPADRISSSIISRTEKSPEHTHPDIKPSPARHRHHTRNISTNTILYNPVAHQHSSSTSPPKSRPMTAKYRSAANTGPHTPSGSGPPTAGQGTPRHASGTKPRQINAPRQPFQAPSPFNVASPQSMQLPSRHIRHRRSSLDVGMSDLGLDSIGAGMVPSSFATQLAIATGGLKRSRSTEDTDGMMGRLLLARMKTLEEGFADIVKEVREMRTAGNSSVGSNDDRPARVKGKQRDVKGKKVPGFVRASSEVNIAVLGQKNSKGKGREETVEVEDIPEGQSRQSAFSKGSSF